MNGPGILNHIKSAYIAKAGFEEQLIAEVPGITGKFQRLYLSSADPIDSLWAQNIWYQPQIIEFKSISEGAKALLSLNKLWHPYIVECARRNALIQEKLPHFSAKRAKFLDLPPSRPLGSYTLLDENHILASPVCSSFRPDGSWEFEENKSEPPNRAYLKLWEFFSRLKVYPKPNSACLEIGASPGGWTWALASLGAKVLACDRAPLDPRIEALPLVSSFLGDGFSQMPQDHPDVDWVFSDVIAYPPKLLEWVNIWKKDPRPRNFVCTIKLQDRKHYDLIQEFKSLPNSGVLHLYHNKHELTWYSLSHSNSIRF